MINDAPADWTVMTRLAAEWKLKLFVGSLLTAFFWAGYFACARASSRPVSMAPILTMDLQVPFVPASAWIYLSQFVTLPLLAWLMTSRRELLAFGQSVALVSGVSFSIFLIWPTFVVRPASVPGEHYLYDLIVRADTSRNACPSLHAAFAVLIAGCAAHTFGWRRGKPLVTAAGLWSAAVLASTLLTKQHVLLDVVAGIAVGVSGCRWYARAARVG